jgi:hypothetical protein
MSVTFLIAASVAATQVTPAASAVQGAQAAQGVQSVQSAQPAQPVKVTLADLRGLVGKPAADSPLSRRMQAAGYDLSCKAQSGRECRFVRTYGTFGVAPSLSLPGGVLISDLRLRLNEGRVGAVTFRARPDRYDKVREVLTHSYGPARRKQKTIKSELGPRPQVTFRWAEGAATLVDPAPPDMSMLVRLTS